MDRTESGGAGLEYELTIAGAIGPALSAALPPLEVASTETWTVLRTVRLSPSEVLDLVQTLSLQGWDIEEVREVDGE